MAAFDCLHQENPPTQASPKSFSFKVVLDLHTPKKKERNVFLFPATPKRHGTRQFVPPPIRRKSKVPSFELSGAPPSPPPLSTKMNAEFFVILVEE
ncbi:hypothetical protein TNCV_466511 [Trichonephila clavipes]|uniref:Uncharacterized protein n=1 Tax=Trichonephila clavipes TaxID=2585209 RepID=A0A8X6R7D8_TRICX|nr:hypothetical protein TNCV_466511 [Trichonephila clavipes]